MKTPPDIENKLQLLELFEKILPSLAIPTTTSKHFNYAILSLRWFDTFFAKQKTLTISGEGS